MYLIDMGANKGGPMCRGLSIFVSLLLYKDAEIGKGCLDFSKWTI
jgi:hypothetical protein